LGKERKFYQGRFRFVQKREEMNMRSKIIGFFALVIVGTVLLSGFSKFNILAQNVKILKTDTSKTASAAETGTALVPNELGNIMILEYHLIGYPEAQWRRTPDNFRQDLQMLYDNGYYPVPLEDLISANLKVPAGKTPFVITFDDSSQGQFRFLKQGNNLVVDPDSAVGIMEAFKKQHPDFPLTATFYVLPEIPKGLRLFGQEEYIQQKLQYLVAHGYEIGNHTYWHQNLGKVDDIGVQKQIALCVKEVQSYVPGYRVHSIALPLGVHSKNRVLEHDGEYQGIKYHNDSILLVGSGPAPSPYSNTFNPYKLERIQAGDTAWGPKAYVSYFAKNPSLRYVSDGDPKTLSVLKNSAQKLVASLGNKYKIKMIE
jgi:Predicted xylanase/chitin deacetylase